ncbi:hypothetical protein EON81_07265 [bacterium]|nr:MAG: hypothetical protein EON81_07265 [bacterium]
MDASVFAETMEIPEEEASGKHAEDYLMQSVGLLADRLAAKMRAAPASERTGGYRLALVLHEIAEERSPRS